MKRKEWHTSCITWTHIGRDHHNREMKEMRWILALIVLAGGAWFLVNRRRRAGRQDAIHYEMPSELRTQSSSGTATPDAMEAQTQTAVSDLSPMAAGVGDAVAEQAAEVAQKAAAAVEGVQQAASAAAGRAEQAVVESMPASGSGKATLSGAEDTAAQATAESDAQPPAGAPIGAPDAPDEDVQTTGMEQAPQIDREEVLERTSGAFIGNKSTRVFHAADANNLPAEDNRVYFDSEDEALAAGFRPAAREGLESAES